MRHVQKRFPAAARSEKFEPEALAADMHMRHIRNDARVSVEGQLRLDRIIGDSGWDDEFIIDGANRHDSLPRRLFRKNEANFRLIAGGSSFRGVMHLEDEIGAGFHEFRLPRLQHERPEARRVAHQELALAKALATMLPSGFFISNQWWNVRFAGFRFAEPLRTRLAHKNDYVMNQSPGARTDLGGRDPFVFGEAAGDDIVRVLDRALGRDVVGFWHFDDHIRFCDVPAIYEMQRGGSILRIASRSFGICPVGERLDVFGGKRTVVGEVAICRVRAPGRHAFGHYGLTNSRRPGAGFLVAQQRHRGGFTRPMAILTILLENRKNIFIKGGRGLGRLKRQR